MKEEPISPATASAPRSKTRRRILQGGLSTGPVLMTVASRPVLGQVCFTPSAAMSMPTSGTRTPQICTGLTPDQWKAIPDQWPSPYLAGTGGSSTVVNSLTDVNATSTDLQSTTNTGTFGSTNTTPIWMMNTSTSSSTATASNTTSTSTSSSTGTLYHCPITGFGGRVFGHRTMMDVLAMTDGGGTNVHSLGRYMVAALLNACSGRTPVLGEDGVRDMWNDLINRGYYEPAAGMRWDAGDIVSYLQTTMG